MAAVAPNPYINEVAGIAADLYRNDLAKKYIDGETPPSYLIRLGIDNAKINNFFDVILPNISGFKDALKDLPLIKNNNIRLLGDLSHDVKRIVFKSFSRPLTEGEDNVINYLGKASGLDEPNREDIDRIVRSFFTNEGKGISVDNDNIYDEMEKTIGQSINDDEIIIPNTDNNTYTSRFKEKIENLGCNTILLDAQTGNVIRDYFTFVGFGTRWIYLCPTVSETDGATKPVKPTIEKEYNMTFLDNLSPFFVKNFFDSRIHKFSVDGQVGTIEVNSTNLPLPGFPISASIRNGFSVNSICKALNFPTVRGTDGVNPNELTINGPPAGVIPDSNKGDILLLKTITDYSQVYYAAFLYHVLGYKTLFITNDTFCLRFAKLFKLPFVLYAGGKTVKGYIFNKDVLKLEQKEIIQILTSIKSYQENAPRIKADIDRNFDTLKARYTKEFNNTSDVSELISNNKILDTLDEIKKRFDKKITTLNAIPPIPDISAITPEFVRDLPDLRQFVDLLQLSTLNIESFSKYFFDNENIDKLMKTQYTNVMKQVRVSIEACEETVNTVEYDTYYKYLVNYVANSPFNEIPNFELLLMALSFYRKTGCYQYLIQYFFTRKANTSDEDYENQLNKLVLVAYYCSLLTFTTSKDFGILGNIFFILKPTKPTENLINEQIEKFIPIISFIKPLDYVPNDIEPNEAYSLYLLSSHLNTHKTNYMTNGSKSVINSKKAFEVYFNLINGPISNENIEEAIKEKNEIYSKYKITKGGIPILEPSYDVTLREIIRTQNLIDLKKYRNTLFDISKEVVPDRKGNAHHYFSVVVIDSIIRKIEEATAAGFSSLNNLLKGKDLDIIYNNLDKYWSAPGKSSIDNEDFIKSNEYFISLFNRLITNDTLKIKTNFELEFSLPTQSTAKRARKSGGGGNIRDDVYKIRPYNIDTDEPLEIMEQSITNDNLYYSFDKYKRILNEIPPGKTYKGSIVSNILDPLVQKIITDFKDKSMDKYIDKLTFYNSMLNILILLRADALESNEGDDYEYNLNQLTLQFIRFDYDSTITSTDLCLFLLDKLLENRTTEKYFKYLIDTSKQIEILSIFEKTFGKVMKLISELKEIKLLKKRGKTNKLSKSKIAKYGSKKKELNELKINKKVSVPPVFAAAPVLPPPIFAAVPPTAASNGYRMKLEEISTPPASPRVSRTVSLANNTSVNTFGNPIVSHNRNGNPVFINKSSGTLYRYNTNRATKQTIRTKVGHISNLARIQTVSAVPGGGKRFKLTRRKKSKGYKKYYKNTHKKNLKRKTRKA